MKYAVGQNARRAPLVGVPILSNGIGATLALPSALFAYRAILPNSKARFPSDPTLKSAGLPTSRPTRPVMSGSGMETPSRRRAQVFVFECEMCKREAMPTTAPTSQSWISPDMSVRMGRNSNAVLTPREFSGKTLTHHYRNHSRTRLRPPWDNKLYRSWPKLMPAVSCPAVRATLFYYFYHKGNSSSAFAL